jgi:hypothetical protein
MVAQFARPVVIVDSQAAGFLDGLCAESPMAVDRKAIGGLDREVRHCHAPENDKARRDCRAFFVQLAGMDATG